MSRGGIALLLLIIGFLPNNSMAQRYASVDKNTAARGHFARARALLVEALAEFESGKRLANPDLLIDTDQWRLTLVSRTEELNRVLDPKPRVTRSGVRFKASSQLIRHDPIYRAKSSAVAPTNTAWEAEQVRNKKPTIKSPKKSLDELVGTKAPKVLPKVSSSKPVVKYEASAVKAEPSAQVTDSYPDTTASGTAAKEVAAVDKEIDAIVENFTSSGMEEDPELLKAIEDAVQDRIDEYGVDPNSEK